MDKGREGTPSAGPHNPHYPDALNVLKGRAPFITIFIQFWATKLRVLRRTDLPAGPATHIVASQGSLVARISGLIKFAMLLRRPQICDDSDVMARE